MVWMFYGLLDRCLKLGPVSKQDYRLSLEGVAQEKVMDAFHSFLTKDRGIRIENLDLDIPTPDLPEGAELEPLVHGPWRELRRGPWYKWACREQVNTIDKQIMHPQNLAHWLAKFVEILFGRKSTAEYFGAMPRTRIGCIRIKVDGITQKEWKLAQSKTGELTETFGVRKEI